MLIIRNIYFINFNIKIKSAGLINIFIMNVSCIMMNLPFV